MQGRFFVLLPIGVLGLERRLSLVKRFRSAHSGASNDLRKGIRRRNAHWNSRTIIRAHCTAFERSQILAAASKKARAHSKQMRNERHKKMMLEIANEYDDAAAKAVLLAIAESLMRFGG
jgi:hypothetical protein